MRTVTLKGASAPRNPRIFKKRVLAADPGCRPGEVVAVRTEDGRFVGRAFFHPRSVIAARILDREEEGPPIDGAWFGERIAGAAALRREVLRLDEVTDAYRVVHAEGDGLSGLVIDRYADVAVIEVGSRGMFEHLREIEDAVREVLGVARVVVRADAEVERVEGFSVRDVRAEPVQVSVVENGLTFRVDCRGGHKTGFFLDQRESRKEVSGLSRGRTVLDLCCYTGGFSLSAARGGAASVRGVDLDERALDVAGENARANGLSVRFEHADVFDFLRSGVSADLVVLDPSKLASKRRDLPRAHKKSLDLNVLGLGAVKPGGLLYTFSCTGLFSHEDFFQQIRQAAARAGRRAKLLRSTGQPPDHPVDVFCPESRYLTGLLLQVT